MVTFNIGRFIISLVATSVLSIRGYQSKSINSSGTIAAFVTGFIHFYASYQYAWILFLFFTSCSWLTRYKSLEKIKIEYKHKQGGQRNAIQVLSNSLPALVICLIQITHTSQEANQPLSSCFGMGSEGTSCQTLLLVAVIAHYACCTGDTWASELGILQKGQPYLITKWKQVPKGTNGGISAIGILASLIGGLFISLGNFLGHWAISLMLDKTSILSSHYLGHWQMAQQSYSIIWIGAFAGLFGSLVDSLLGAKYQYSAYDKVIKKVVNSPGPNTVHISGKNILTNEGVNLAAAIMTMLTVLFISYWFMS